MKCEGGVHIVIILFLLKFYGIVLIVITLLVNDIGVLRGTPLNEGVLFLFVTHDINHLLVLDVPLLFPRFHLLIVGKFQVGLHGFPSVHVM